MDDWKYIDEYDRLPDATYIHCDTRDFHIKVSNDISSGIDPKIKKMIKNATDDNKFNRSEILGCLKTLESGSGGKGSWRMLTIKHGYKDWLKYVRFVKTDEIVQLAGGPELVYVVYTTHAGDPCLLNRDDLTDSNINNKDEYLNFIEDD